MSKAKPIGYICFNKENMSEEDRELAELYWQFDDKNPKIFYRLNIIMDKFGLSQHQITSTVRLNYGFSCNLSQFSCENCGSKKPVFSRTAYTRSRSKKTFKCNECIAEFEAEQNKIQTDLLQQLEDECLCSNYHINDFSFIEKIFVLTFLSNNHHLSFDDPFSLTRIDIITGNQDLDLEIITALVEKKIIFDSAEYSGGLDIHSILDEDSYQRNFFLFKKSNKYLEKNALITSLYESIISLEVKKKDLDDINRIIESMRLNNIYTLSHYWANKFSIEIKLTTRIDSTFKYMARKFTLMQCARIVFNQAKNLAAYLYSNDINYHVQKNLFANFLDRYLGKVEIEEWTVNPSNSLPEPINNSLFESMVYDFFMPKKINWYEMTTKEIMEEWVSKLNVIED